jgi:membrane protein
LRPAPLGWLRAFGQLAVVIAQSLVRDQLLLHAHRLTYLTLLSIVPLLALAAAIVELVGGSEQVIAWIVEQVAAGSPEAAERILRWAADFNFGALGSVSGAVLIGITLIAVGGVEHALNVIWGVQKQRPWVRRVSDYLAVLIVAPLLLGIAIPLRTTFESQWIVQRMLELPGFQLVYDTGLQQAPSLLMIAAFSFLYWFLPNTEVRSLSALLGGVVAGLLFGLAQTLYLGFSLGAARYDAIFGALAFFPLLMVWVYVSWAIILFGAEVAYAHQTLPRYRREVRGARPGPAAREAVGVAIAAEVARAFRDGRAPWTEEELSDALDVPLRTVRAVMAELEAAGLVRACDREGPHGYQLGRPAESIEVHHVLAALRGPRTPPAGPSDVARVVAEVFAEVDEKAACAAEARTLADLIAPLVARS